MKNLLILFISLTLNLIGLEVNAARVDSGNNAKVYFDENGKKVSALEADRLATFDKYVLQCTPVEKVCNERTGKCTIKTVK